MTQQHPFRFGVINERMSSYKDWIAKARRTEELGYATILLRDHFIQEPFGDQFAPIAALMAAANATTTLRVGSLVFDNDYRHPVVLAKEAATLDVLSKGRFELGIGAGWLRTEYEQAGMPFDAPGVRVSRLEGALHVLKGLFADKPLTYAGTHYNITKLNGFPKPLQRPHPPILVGGAGKRVLSIAGREADIVGILNASLASGTVVADPNEMSAATVNRKLEWVRQAAEDRFERIELSMVITVLITEQRDQKAEDFMNQRRWNDVSIEQVLDMPSVFIGSLEQIAEQMQERRRQYGFSYYIVSDEDMDNFAPIVAQLSGK
jgi:probable F420-dependent oxidoreductase